MELLDVAAEGDRVVLRELRHAVLQLERVVAEQIERRERLVAERRVRAARAVADDDEREGRHLALVAAALVLMRHADEQVVRHVAAEHRVPLADARTQVLQDLVVRVGEGEELRRVGLARRAERGRSRLRHVAARVELVVAERDLVRAVDVVVALHHPRLARRHLRNVVERARVVVDVGRQKVAQGAQVRRQHTRGVAADRRAARIGLKRRERARILLLLVRAEREQTVLDDRPAGPHAGRVGGEGTRIDRLPGRVGADERLVACAVVRRRRERVRPAARDGVDAGADEVSLPHVVRRDVHLHLLDRLERNRCDARAVADAAGRGAEAERVVEVRAVNRHIVRAVVLSGEGARAAVLRRQTRDVGDAARNRRQRGEILAHDRRRGAGVRRAEDRIARADDGDRLGQGRDLQGELDVLRDAEGQRDVVLHLGREPAELRGDRVRSTDAHARNREAAVSLRDRFVRRARRLMHRGDARARDDTARRVLDQSRD